MKFIGHVPAAKALDKAGVANPDAGFVALGKAADATRLRRGLSRAALLGARHALGLESGGRSPAGWVAGRATFGCDGYGPSADMLIIGRLDVRRASGRACVLSHAQETR